MTPVSLTSSDLSNAKLAPLGRAKQLAATLLSERSEASGALVARELHEVLRALDASDRHGFQRYLATEFQPDRAALRAAASSVSCDNRGVTAVASPSTKATSTKMSGSPGSAGWKKAKQRRSGASRRRRSSQPLISCTAS